MYVVAEFHAKPGCEQLLSEALLGIVKPTRGEPGCLEIHVSRALRDPATFLIQSTWTDEGAFEKHAVMPHMKAFLASVPEWIDQELRAVRCTRLA